MRTTIVLLFLASVAWNQSLCQENEPVVSRGLLKRGLLAKGKQTTTTTTTQAPQEEVEYEEVEYPEGEQQQEPSTEAPSSTEGKKLLGGGVRPFRSNTDLLAALKRRRAQAAEAKLNHSHPSSSAAPVQEVVTEAPVKSTYNKKRFNSGAQNSNQDSNSGASKPLRNRFSRPKTAPEPQVEEPSEPSQPTNARIARTFRRGGY